MKNKTLNMILYCLVSIICAVLSGIVLMLLVYLLPTDTIRTNVEKSIDIFKTENDNYHWAYWISSSRPDNFTDSIMLLNAIYEGPESLTEKAMLNPRTEYQECSRSESLVRNLESEGNSDNSYTAYYARYWHGYLTLLKPFLFFFSFSDWRMCSMILQLILLCFVLYFIEKKLNEKIAFCYLLAMIAMNPISSAICMQYACMYNMTLIGSLIVIRSGLRDERNLCRLFLWLGIATAFFDFLTFPIVPLGIMLILYLLLNDDLQLGSRISAVVKSSLIWGIGYGGMWSGKWIAADLLTGQNVFLSSIGNVVYRMNGDPFEESQLTSLNVLYIFAKNVQKYINAPMLILAAVVILIGLYVVLCEKVHFKFQKKNLVLLVVGLYPIGWYSIVRNHSLIHSWMVHRDLVVMIFAGLAFFCESITGWRHHISDCPEHIRYEQIDQIEKIKPEEDR